MHPPRLPRLLRLAVGALIAAAGAGLFGLADRPGQPMAVQAQERGAFRARGPTPYNTVFAPDGSRPEAETPRFARPPPEAYWSSWNASEAGLGRVSLGPFPGPAAVEIPVIGYPAVAGNALYLENDQNHERIAVAGSNIGSRWARVRLRLPAAWRGKPLHLVAVNGSSGKYGWMAVGAPAAIAPLACAWTPFVRYLWGVAMAGGLLGVCWKAALQALGGRLPPAARPIAALGLTSVAAYGVFWLFLASPTAGWAGSLVLLAIAAWVAAGASPPVPRDCWTPLRLMGPIALAYLAITFLYPSHRPVFDVIARRHVQALAVDNQLPAMLAVPLLEGKDPRLIAYGWWHSSERPPLQTGYALLLAAPLHLAGVDFEEAAQAVGLWLQLAWVGGLWAWLRGIGLPRSRAVAVLLAISLTGFLLLNSVYVWPKLLAAAFALGAVALGWLAEEAPGVPIASGGLLALAYLSHGGIAFSFLALLPCALLFRPRAGVRAWAVAAAVFLVLVLPWSFYQKVYDPPGDYLLKFHLGGAIPRDQRTLGEVLAAAYRDVPVSTLLHARLANARTLFQGPWGHRLGLGTVSVLDARQAEFYGLFYSLGFWNFGALACAVLLARRGRLAPERRRGLLLGGTWALATLGVWVLLMYLPGSTVVHQGSYAAPLLLLATFACALQEVRTWLFWLVAAANGAVFLIDWLPPLPGEPAEPQVAPLAALAAAAFLLAREVLRAGRETEPDAPPLTAAEASPGPAAGKAPA